MISIYEIYTSNNFIDYKTYANTMHLKPVIRNTCFLVRLNINFILKIKKNDTINYNVIYILDILYVLTCKEKLWL